MAVRVGGDDAHPGHVLVDGQGAADNAAAAAG